MNIINSYRFAAGAAFDGFGNASRSFDGTNDYIDLGDSDDFSFGDGAGNDSPFSIAAWVKLDVTTGSNRAIVSKYGGISNAEWMLFYHASSNEFRWAVYNENSGTGWIRARSSLTINASQWYHVVGTYDGSKSLSGIKIYVDGSLDTANDSSGTYAGMTNGTPPIYIGQYSSTWFLDGKVADVRLYDAELGSSTIADLANGTDYQTNLVGWWLDDDDDVLDNAGTNDGTNNGTTYDADGPNG